MTPQIRPATAGDADALHALRLALWPDEELGRDALATGLAACDPDAATFVAALDDGLVAFVEATLRHDYVEGCDSSPVTFVEGLYVAPAHRRHGLARALVDRVAAWGRAHGCAELASNALLDNPGSHAFHAAIGFEETERVVYFRRSLA